MKLLRSDRRLGYASLPALRLLVGLATLFAVAGALWTFGRRGAGEGPDSAAAADNSSTAPFGKSDREAGRTVDSEDPTTDPKPTADSPPGSPGGSLPKTGPWPGSLTLRTHSPRQRVEQIVASGHFNAEHLLPFATEAAMDLLLLTGRGQQVATLSDPLPKDPLNQLRLVRNAGSRMFVADAERSEFPWLFELARWHPAADRPLAQVVSDLREALSQVEAVCRQLDPDYPGAP
jgi:hypothetical protein